MPDALFENLVAMAGVVDLAQYDEPLSSRDGILLIRGGGTNLCLCNPLAGSCSFLPAATFGAQKTTCTYVLVTGHATGESSVVWVLAFRRGVNVKNGVIYRIFSSTSGEWGPVKRSAKFKKGLRCVDMGCPNEVVVCGSSVYSFVWQYTGRRSTTHE
ncbi:hypothetical protein HU200_066227 [Digitaria exilis]|uniref:Uncharacterized protein n=1 Tax=Digitaria exilis TaxID=1010633 RepID=A0A835A2D0_9POAL|nr:hypothetical protein HU200_066227 [Digitaria exilis]